VLNRTTMQRPIRIFLVVLLLIVYWPAMMAIHELGHVLGAILTGGIVERVVLHPWAISRTDLSHNPHPLFVAWAGPITGTILPLFLLGVWKALRLPGEFFLKLFAGFCLIANGAYVGFGAFGRIGDAGVLLRHGADDWMLWTFGVSAFAGGLLLWHRLSWNPQARGT